MTSAIGTVFLRDDQHGGDVGQLQVLADALAAFVDGASASVDVAIYDFRLTDPTATATVVDAFTGAAARGVAVRIAYDAGKPVTGTAADFARLEADPAPPGTGEWVAQHFVGTGVEFAPIVAGGQLMHCKYVVRDALVPEAAAVWTGSTNFTDAAWTRQENNVITVAEPTMAAAYRKDFDQMWSSGKISGTGADGGGTASVGAATVGWDFCPGDGVAVNAALAARVSAATERLVVASMVLTSHEVLAALAAAIDRGVPLTGIFDGGQMDPIVRQWKKIPADTQVVANWERVSALLSDKQSAPYTPDGPHDFMHLKVLVADDTVVTGSYNFSANAERNAENQIHLDDPDTVAAYVAYLDTVIATYAG
jgi:phosphatidylserine/phosphatidylglycerophosphate/cardiolipin synthase-like enzyme